MKTVTIPPQAANQSLSKKLRVVLLALLVVGLVVIAAYVVPQPATTAPASSRPAYSENQEALKDVWLARGSQPAVTAKPENDRVKALKEQRPPSAAELEAFRVTERTMAQEGLKEWWLEQYGPKEMNSSQSQEGLKEWWLEQYGPRS